MMDMMDYQVSALRTVAGENGEHNAPNWAMGLCGESGEVADLLKKHIYHGHGLDVAELAKELGDVLWYVTVLADAYGMTLGEVARLNVSKLERRYPSGFSEEASRERAE